MSDERYSPESWQRQYSPVADWDQTFRDRQWDCLADLSETARHALVAGYVHKFVRQGQVLDVGCAEGALIDYLHTSRIEYTGFDISPTAIHRAQARRPSIRLFSCSVEDFAPPEGLQYDVVIFSDVLSVLKRPIEMIDRYYSFLRPAGHFIFCQFQSVRPDGNGAVITRMFEAELAAGRYRAAARSEALDVDTGRKWRIYCLSQA